MSNIRITLYKFTGAGNDFVVIDGRKGGVDEFRTVERIVELCREYKTDGLMILTTAPKAEISGTSQKMTEVIAPPMAKGTSSRMTEVIAPPMAKGTSSRMTEEGSKAVDFVMEFYNPDGTGGMMCGNGGRCITAFADMLGLKPAAADGTWHFLAPDGMHEAKILDRSFVGQCPPQDDKGCHSEHTPCHSERSEESKWTVRLKMIDVDGVTPMMGGYFLNTGTRHFVKFVNDVDSIDMERDAKPLRWDPAFQPVGTNVNFVERRQDGLHVRTYEKGVEGETLACGTGITASAIASMFEMPNQVGHDVAAAGQIAANCGHDGAVVEQEVADGGHDGAAAWLDGVVPGQNGVKLQCRRGDWLKVEFEQNGSKFNNVYLTGPAELVAVLKNSPKTRTAP